VVDISIAICTYNGAERLSQVFDCLQQQVRTEGIAWEVLVVDNHSTDNTRAVVTHFQSLTKWDVPLRYIFEPRQGIAFARNRAIHEAQGKLIGFIDDDNLPSSTWVVNAHQFGTLHLHVGAYGGCVKGRFAIPPPQHFERISSLLALQDYGATSLPLNPERMQLPSGAGLVVRKIAWQSNVPTQPQLIGRVRGSMLAGDDYEALLHMHRQGWEIWYEPAMEIIHNIPAKRLQPSYLRAIAWGSGLVMCHLWMIGTAQWKCPWVCCKILLGNLRQVLVRLFLYRFKIWTDWVVVVEITFFLAAAISPLYFFYSQVHRKS
jgi:cellulose synthase/poly-beta-1,6-N-acetylglucosamine synthase-like glycosyltransferase